MIRSTVEIKMPDSAEVWRPVACHMEQNLWCSRNKHLSWWWLCVLLLRPDREEASVMPLINAGFNRVRNIMCVCVCSLPVFVLFSWNVLQPHLSALKGRDTDCLPRRQTHRAKMNHCYSWHELHCNMSYNDNDFKLPLIDPLLYFALWCSEICGECQYDGLL